MPVPERCNCLIWAVCMRVLFGGRIAWEWRLLWPHFFWVDWQGRRWNYTTGAPARLDRELFWFRGEVREG